MAITPNTTFTSGAVLTADQMNRLPWGVMGRATATANQTGITTVTDITGLSVTFTADSTRIYKTTIWIPNAAQNTTASYPIISVANASNTILTDSVTYMTAGDEKVITVIYTETGISGSTTRKARASVANGSLTLAASSTRVMSIVVEDIGKA